MPTPIRTAVLGYGLAGRVFHCPFVSAIPGLELAAIVPSSRPASRSGEQAALAYPKARILGSAEEAFADPGIDLVVVATPNETHVELATRALEAGKHAVVDKPVAGTAAEARALADLATRQGKLLIPFHNRRWDADFLTLRKLFAEGTLGRVVEVRSRWDRFRPIQKSGTWKEAASPVHGILYDLGPHLVDQALSLFGAPEQITGSVRRDRDETDVTDAFDITLHYTREGRGLRYHCSATMIAAESAPRFIVHGTEGSFVKHGLDPQEPVLVPATMDPHGLRPPQLGADLPDGAPWLAEPQSAYGTLTVCTNPVDATEFTRAAYTSLPGDYRLFYAGVRDAVLGNAPPPVSAEDGYRVIRLLDLAVASSEQGRTLPVTFTGSGTA